MTVADKRELIKNTLAECADTPNFAQAATKLLNILGYESPDALDMSAEEFTESAKDFIAQYPSLTNTPPGTKSEKELIKAVKSIRIIFEYGEQEFRPGLPGINVGNTNHDFVFIAVELKDEDYPRSKYVALAREINKRFLRLTVVLFRANKSLNMAFFDRRPHKKDEDRDVLQKVSLLSDIDCQNPHTGHLDILAELSLDERVAWMNRERRPENIDGLRMAWLNALSVDVLNKRFYRELLAWFNLAGDNIKLPKKLRPKSDEWRIRLITRMLFIWFIKENKLVADKLFNKADVKFILKRFDGENGDSYYRAVLQNLFFAVLNTPISERKFKSETDHDFYLYHYKNEIAKPDQLIKLFAQTPFINGGLFDCLDDRENTSHGAHVDCFADSGGGGGRTISVPDKLFFGNDGLISLFEKYKFTIHENTPIEQEVALDPELLGKTFENLLAAHTPETQENARRQTGSYYTPREIVDYMLAESLTQSLLTKISGDQKEREQVRALFDYGDSEHDSSKQNFIKANSKKLVRAIADIKIFDLAVGSGAFPMSALHLLSLALSKLDPKNNEWKKLQTERAQKDAARIFDKSASKEREKRFQEINDTFEKYSDEFGRKLYLIQNSIFGADIQPIACQIAKLRFFISLAIEQTPDKNAKNHGIKPLPNLETRIVAANTLIAIRQKGKMDALVSPEINNKEAEIMQNRERYFNASGRRQKIDCVNRDGVLRQELAQLLANGKFLAADDARKITAWNPYDQNAPAADWFDAEYMFGVVEGFDIVIGNPPYVMLRTLPENKKAILRRQNFTSFHGIGDMYMLFYEKGLQLCRAGGILTFITSNTWMRSNAATGLRSVLMAKDPRMLINMGGNVFDNVSVSTNILLIFANNNSNQLYCADLVRDATFPPEKWIRITPQNKWAIVPSSAQSIINKIEKIGTPISQWDSKINIGIFTGYDDAFVIDNLTKEHLCDDDPNTDVIKPTIRGKNIDKYFYTGGNEWVIKVSQGWTNQNRGKQDPERFFRARYPKIWQHLTNYAGQSARGHGLINRDNMGDYWWELRSCTYYHVFEREKLMWREISKTGMFVYDTQKFYPLSTVFVMTGASIQYLLAVLNSHLISWYMPNIAVNLGDTGLRWRKTYVEKIPIPKISKAEQVPFIQLVKKITAAKQTDPAADTTVDEKKIDRLVYQLYGLTEEEIKIVESPTTPQTE